MQSWKARLALMFAMMAMLIVVAVPAMAQQEDFLGDAEIFCEDFDEDGFDDDEFVECEDPFLVFELEDIFGSDFSSLDLDGDGFLDGVEIFCEDFDEDGLDDDEFFECEDPVIISE